MVTLHAVVKGASDRGLVGTDVGLNGVSDAGISDAKSFFLKFSNQAVLDETSYGQILETIKGCKSRIYVTGMLVAEEENFAFSYNITSLTATMRKALNRERTNVGRTAYGDRVKQMLLASKAETVAEALAEDLQRIEKGTNRDEVKWTDVAVHACQILNASKRVVFVTASDLTMFRDAVDHAENDGFKIVTVPETIRNSLWALLTSMATRSETSVSSGRNTRRASNSSSSVQKTLVNRNRRSLRCVRKSRAWLGEFRRR